jgi:hypothetical protein
MNLDEQTEQLKQNLEMYKQKILELNQSVIIADNIKNDSINFKDIAHAIMFLNQKIKSAESLLNYYNYKKE